MLMGSQWDDVRRDSQPGVPFVDDAEVGDRCADGMPPGIGDDPARPGLRVRGPAADPGRAGHRLPQRQPQERASAHMDGEHADALVQGGRQPGLRGAGVGIRPGRGVHGDQVVATQIGETIRHELADFHVVPEGRQDAGDPFRCRGERMPRVRIRSAAGQDQRSGHCPFLRSSLRRRPRPGWCTSGCRRRPATAPSARYCRLHGPPQSADVPKLSQFVRNTHRTPCQNDVRRWQDAESTSSGWLRDGRT